MASRSAWHLVQRAGVGDAAVPVGRHLGIVRGGVALGVANPVGLRRERRIVRCVLGGVTTRSVLRGAREVWEAGKLAAGGRAAPGRRPRGAPEPEPPWVPVARALLVAGVTHMHAWFRSWLDLVAELKLVDHK